MLRIRMAFWKNLNICLKCNLMLCSTTDVVSLYPSIPHEIGLKVLYDKLEERVTKEIPSPNLINVSEFALKNNYF